MPVDLVIDSDYSVKDLVDVNEIIAKIQKTCPKMLMVLLDMCRTIPTEEKNPRIRSEMPKEVPRDSRTNLVMAWATSENSSAYEVHFLFSLSKAKIKSKKIKRRFFFIFLVPCSWYR